jgi:hypothetical protein
MEEGLKKKKYIQFVAIFHLLKNERLMTYFESLKKLFKFLNFFLMPPKNIGQIQVDGIW